MNGRIIKWKDSCISVCYDIMSNYFVLNDRSWLEQKATNELSCWTQKRWWINEVADTMPRKKNVNEEEEKCGWTRVAQSSAMPLYASECMCVYLQNRSKTIQFNQMRWWFVRRVCPLAHCIVCCNESYVDMSLSRCGNAPPSFRFAQFIIDNRMGVLDVHALWTATKRRPEQTRFPRIDFPRLINSNLILNWKIKLLFELALRRCAAIVATEKLLLHSHAPLAHSSHTYSNMHWAFVLCAVGSFAMHSMVILITIVIIMFRWHFVGISYRRFM